MSIFGNIMHETSWYLAQLKPNAHRIAERNLRRQGFETFLPLVEVTRRKSTTFVNELRPLFPGYMFVGFKPNAMPWRKINSTHGVSRLVSFNGVPKLVPSSLVSELRNRCDGDGRLLPSQAPIVGTNIKISAGPFTEFVGTVEKIETNQRIWVLLDLLGQKTRVLIDKTEVN